ncbi:MAG TPA: hypothetical protein VLC74_03725 [Rhizomicrobium sp.]|nr:hypothetical protein [Rhizomicrobium sp.]
MRGVWMTGVAAAFALSGCADMAASMALSDAQAKCAKLGKQFVPDDVKKTELVVVSSAQVSGHCAGPGDPGFVPAPSAPPNR